MSTTVHTRFRPSDWERTMLYCTFLSAGYFSTPSTSLRASQALDWESVPAARAGTGATRAKHARFCPTSGTWYAIHRTLITSSYVQLCRVSPTVSFNLQCTSLGTYAGGHRIHSSYLCWWAVYFGYPALLLYVVHSGAQVPLSHGIGGLTQNLCRPIAARVGVRPYKQRYTRDLLCCRITFYAGGQYRVQTSIHRHPSTYYDLSMGTRVHTLIPSMVHQYIL